MNVVEPIRNKNDLKKIENVLRKQNMRDLLLFTVGTNCGLRISDILSLNVGDVRGKNYISIVEKKTGKKRFLLCNGLLVEMEKYTKNMKTGEYLFKSRKGENRQNNNSTSL